MRADPGLLYYFLERVIEGGGWPPADFRTDPRVEHPALTDLPALDSISQEFPIAWAYLLAGRPVPLHVFALWFMGIFASLTAVGVYLLALELTGRIRWACLAVLLSSVLLSGYRTIGFILIREDFSVPFFVLHLALLARAARVRTPAAMALCALALAAALASWHAMRFVVTVEVLCLFLWFLRTGQNPVRARGAWLVPAIVAAASLAVPFLRRTGFLLSAPMLLALGLLAAAWATSRGRGRLATTAIGVSVVVGLGLGRAALAIHGGWDDYSHVSQLLVAKILHLGQLPADPAALPFEARMMWQGPFSTLALTTWPVLFGAGLCVFLPAAAAAAWGWLSGKGEATASLLGAFTAAGLAGAWLVERMMTVPAIALPVAAVVFLGRLRLHRVALALMIGAVLWQGAVFARVMASYRIGWYETPEVAREYRAFLRALPGLVPEGEAVVADPVVSTAILAHARRSIVLQPKWEASEQRRRLQDFLVTFFHGTPEDLRRLLLEKYRCRYVLVDRGLWARTRYIAGLPLAQSAPTPGTAAAALLGAEPGRPDSVPGYRLRYGNPTGRSGSASGLLRLYELIEPAAAPPA
jgi:hypothetical protein